MALLIYLNAAPQSAGFADGDHYGDQDPDEGAIDSEAYRYLPETRYVEADALYKHLSPRKCRL